MGWAQSETRSSSHSEPKIQVYAGYQRFIPMIELRPVKPAEGNLADNFSVGYLKLYGETMRKFLPVLASIGVPQDQLEKIAAQNPV